MASYTDCGVVIRNHKLGEADRIVSVLTRDHGIVRAVAKGARRGRSKMGASLEPFRHVNLQLYVGRGQLQTVTEVDVREQWHSLRTDLGKLETAYTLIEAGTAMAAEGRGDVRLYEMVAGALRTLDGRDSPMLLPAFLLKLLDHGGLAPELNECVSAPGCGGAQGAVAAGGSGAGPTGVAAPLVSLSFSNGGATCRTHRSGPDVSSAAFSVMRAVLGGGLTDVLELPSSPTTLEVRNVVQSLWEFHLERPLRSAHALT